MRQFIIEPMELEDFMLELEKLDKNKDLLAPHDIFGMGTQKIPNTPEVEEILRDKLEHWQKSISEVTYFSIPVSYSDAYLISMDNSAINSFDPRCAGPLD